MRAWIAVWAVASCLACSPHNSGGGDDGPPGPGGPGTDGGTGGGDGGGGGGDGGGGCVGLQCRVVDCKAQGKPSTTLSGVVNIPAGNLPLYNATVYVPNRPLKDIGDGPSCDLCGAQADGDPVTLTHTGADGSFSLPNVPAGPMVPLVVSLGKWRREITLANVAACTETPLSADLTRLPRNQAEGHIPKIALTTGGYDAIECLLRKLGIADSEFTPEGGGGRVNLFAGHGGTNAYDATLNGGAAFTVASDANGKPGWWSQKGSLSKYDIVLFSCEGGQYLTEKSSDARAALQDFIDHGGKAFASHWHNVWIQDGPAPLNTVATFIPFPATEFDTITATIDQSFDRGRALATWLAGVDPIDAKGQLTILKARNTVKTLSSKLTQRFVYYNDPDGAQDPQYFTFNAPVGAPANMQCGRMVFTDMHVSGNDGNDTTGKDFDPGLDYSSPDTPFPNGCVTTAISPQEKALIFLLFDLSGCVTPVIG